MSLLKLFSFLIIFSLVSCTTPTTPVNSTAANYNIELGLNYLQQGDVERAKYKLLMAQQQAPRDPAVQDALGYFSERIGEDAQAKKYYLSALALAPTSGKTQNNYGAFLCRQQQYPEAIEHFKIAANDPDYLHPAQAYENAGLCALKIPDLASATIFFQKAIAHDPRRPTTLYQLARINYQQHNDQLARQYLADYLKIAKPDTKTLQLLKMVHLRKS